MPALKGSKTVENLKAAFAGESQANRRYLYFAQKADVEGYNDVAAVFRSTAEGETGHAHGHLEYLEEVGDPATGLPIGKTGDNLKAAVAGETHEYTDMYPGMARTAREEGFDEIADWFETLAKAEKSHAGRFQRRWTSWAELTNRPIASDVHPLSRGAGSEGLEDEDERMREGSLEAPTRHALDWQDEEFYDPAASTGDCAGSSTSATAAGAASICAIPFPAVRPDRRGEDRRARRRRQRRLQAGHGRLHAVRHVLHDQVPLRAAARVRRRFPASDAALPRRGGAAGQGCRSVDRQLAETDRNGKLAGIAAPLANWASDTRQQADAAGCGERRRHRTARPRCRNSQPGASRRRPRPRHRR